MTTPLSHGQLANQTGTGGRRSCEKRNPERGWGREEGRKGGVAARKMRNASLGTRDASMSPPRRVCCVPSVGPTAGVVWTARAENLRYGIICMPRTAHALLPVPWACGVPALGLDRDAHLPTHRYTPSTVPRPTCCACARFAMPCAARISHHLSYPTTRYPLPATRYPRTRLIPTFLTGSCRQPSSPCTMSCYARLCVRATR